MLHLYLIHLFHDKINYLTLGEDHLKVDKLVGSLTYPGPTKTEIKVILIALSYEVLELLHYSITKITEIKMK